MMKIKHITFSTAGGAGTVAKRLFTYQQSVGIDAELYYKSESRLANFEIKNIDTLIRASVDNYILKSASYPSLFSILRNRKQIKIDLDFIDVIHLHWPTGIFDIFKNVNNVSPLLKIVWTLHDYHAVTGGCHLVQECEKDKELCASCPAMRNIFKNIPRNIMINKLNLISEINNLNFVAPSGFMKNRLILNPLVKNNEISVIPNPLDDIFLIKKKNRSKEKESIDPLEVGFIAINLEDKNKRFLETKKILIKLANEKNIKINLLVISSSRQKIESYGNLVIKYINKRSINDYINKLDGLDILVSSSISETFGLSVLEALARGVPVIIVKGSATSELITDGYNGIMSENMEHLADLIYKIHNNRQLLNKLKSNTSNTNLNKYSLKSVNDKYVELYTRQN